LDHSPRSDGGWLNGNCLPGHRPGAAPG
jgi:hypothetical protein